MATHLDAAREALEEGKISVVIDRLWSAYPALNMSPTEETLERFDSIADLAGRAREKSKPRQARRIDELLSQLNEERPRVEAQVRELALAAQAREESARDAAARLARDRLAAIRNSRRRRDTEAVRVFEYAVVEIEGPSESRQETLVEAGSLGWELVSVSPAGSTDRCYLKREVWASADAEGQVSTSAPQFAPSKKGAAAGGGFFAAGFYESGPDLDLDGDVDGGLMDSLGTCSDSGPGRPRPRKT